jgi:hypothetical protein
MCDDGHEVGKRSPCTDEDIDFARRNGGSFHVDEHDRRDLKCLRLTVDGEVAAALILDVGQRPTEHLCSISVRPQCQDYGLEASLLEEIDDGAESGTCFYGQFEEWMRPIFEESGYVVLDAGTGTGDFSNVRFISGDPTLIFVTQDMNPTITYQGPNR